MWPFTRRPDPPLDKSRADAIEERMNQLETRMERVEVDNTERQMTVLTASEKVLHQLRARERKRVKDGTAEEEDGGENTEPSSGERERAPMRSTANLARRFKRF